ncbi:hypothetical protein FQA39_LY06786 [Lamprigera yunnana]|nr:hypothetical protein FQA39_LY06786 [Lamprigera yunnana]
MGWTTGMHLPIANNENKVLQEQVEALIIRKAKATQLYDTEENRYSAFLKHSKYVEQQSNENQQLLTNYHQHLETQEHTFLLRQSEKERVQQETRQTHKLWDDINGRVTLKKNDLEKGYTKMEKKKLEANWDNEALKAWEESLKKRDEDTQILKKFSQEDEKKAKDLEIKRQNLQSEIVLQTKILNRVVGDVANYELIIERVGRVFKKQKDERTALLKQWKDAVDTLKRRDRNMKHIIIEIETTNQLFLEKRDTLEEQNTFLRNQMKNNKEMEVKVQELNYISSKMRQNLNDLIQIVLTLNGELNSLKRALISTANFLEKNRMTGKNLIKNVTEKEGQIKQYLGEIGKLKKQLANVENTSESATERASQLENITQEQQKETKLLEQDIERTQVILFRTTQALNELKNSTKSKETEISGTDVRIALLRKNIVALNNEIKKQKELNYGLDFSINDMNSRLDKILGNTVNEDSQALREKVAELEKHFSDENELKLIIQNQIVGIEDEMRRLTTTIQSDNNQMYTLKDKLQNEILSCEDGAKQSKEAKLRTQQKQVNENVLRLRVNELENLMKREASSIYNMQKFRLELEIAMKERQIEINTNIEILLIKRRNLDEEKCRLKRDISLRLTKIHQLQERFHIAQMSLGKDEDGQPLSVTHFKIKNAQEKHMLQEEGDAMDMKIKKFEKEIIAMENTLKIVSLSNVTYKQNLSAVNEFDEKYQEKNKLEAEISAKNCIIRSKNDELARKKMYLKDTIRLPIQCAQDKDEQHGDLENGHVQ